MLCTEFSLLFSLMSTVLNVTVHYNGTDVKDGVPILHYHDEDPGYGSLEIRLPEELALDYFMWNDTRPSYNMSHNVTLRDHAFRFVD